ncbi:polymorphic toxin type 33 domain-containing protein (plasmid) [Leptospira weilii]|uniref:polymorphic toxin type 33 domain-containing protein n=1 Tax=Leptospira weilii TaxID=28184 RepID=UPI00201B587D|nr:polymorphic toxin type 33 domain-containing protein [Leptospira weilii]UPY81064.1 polymorphic toxin type 33 domain-containing protein [Leptospira weilii]
MHPNSKTFINKSPAAWDGLVSKGINAHDLKKAFLGKNADIALYDLYVNKNTKEIYIFRKSGKGEGIPTGEFIQ